MHFLPDVYITCDECKGSRYNRETLEIKFKELGQPIRLLLTNSLNGPSVAKVMEIIGKELSLNKLNQS